MAQRLLDCNVRTVPANGNKNRTQARSAFLGLAGSDLLVTLANSSAQKLVAADSIRRATYPPGYLIVAYSWLRHPVMTYQADMACRMRKWGLHPVPCQAYFICTRATAVHCMPPSMSFFRHSPRQAHSPELLRVGRPFRPTVVHSSCICALELWVVAAVGEVLVSLQTGWVALVA